MSGKTKFVIALLLLPVLIVVLIIGWTRPGSLSIARKLKYSIVFIGLYVSYFSYSYAAMKKEKGE